MIYDVEKARYIPNELEKKRMAALNMAADDESVSEYARMIRMKEAKEAMMSAKFMATERYSFGWNDARQIIEQSKQLDELGLEPTGFRIRWWHRVIHWLWKRARRYV